MSTEDAQQMTKLQHVLIGAFPVLLIAYGVVVVAGQAFVTPARYSTPHLVTGLAAIIHGLGLICIGASYFLWLKWPVNDKEDEVVVLSYHRAVFIVGIVLVLVSALMS